MDNTQLSEEDIKTRFITPAIKDAGWRDQQVRMEAQITDGKINLRGNLRVRSTPKRADYLLHLAPNRPIAVIEAKNARRTVSHGLQQAMAYAQMLDLPFAYSSNGEAFFEHDFLTGKERELPLSAFPSPDELRQRSERGLTEAEKQIQAQPWYTSQNTHAPRYYQRIAVNRVVEAIARGQQRLLLVMATGTGKTYTAFQIVWRLLKSGMARRVLYLADRNILVDQSIQQDFAPLEKTIHKVNFAKDDPATVTAYEVYFSLYQQLADRAGDDVADGGEEGETARRREKSTRLRPRRRHPCRIACRGHHSGRRLAGDDVETERCSVPDVALKGRRRGDEAPLCPGAARQRRKDRVNCPTSANPARLNIRSWKRTPTAPSSALNTATRKNAATTA